MSTLRVDTIANTAGVTTNRVLQVVTLEHSVYTSSGSSATDLALWNFSISNVTAGSSIQGNLSISKLSKDAGSEQWLIKNAAGTLLGAIKTITNGTTSWHSPQTSISFEDPSPSVGTNTYYLSLTANMQIYSNYPSSYGNGISTVQLMEVAG